MPPVDIVPTLPGLVAAEMLDAPLAGLAWLLLEDGIPVLVCAPGQDARDTLLEALVRALPAHRQPVQAAPLPGRLVRVAAPLALATPPGALRAALAATTGRSGLAATIEALDLAEVLGVLRRQGLTDDEISFLGVVLVLGSEDEGAGPRGFARVVAAHYLRPVARDVGGHIQRLGPAVLATWDPRRRGYDHFAWGIYPELAARTGRRAGDLERAHTERSERLQPEGSRGPG